ncbi:MAG: AIR synthase-related protein, partial [Bdellovibrionaceae bacterium]|nr:AIR synthase-related protein [Pseudobdellovibrionaceae bacterium]
PVLNLEDFNEWVRWNLRYHWGMNQGELESVRNFFLSAETRSYRKKVGLPLGPTLIEMECVAQTWSEHCRHKIFNSPIDYRENISVGPGGSPVTHTFKKLGATKIPGIFKSLIRKVTDELRSEKNWLVSVFNDNAGVVQWSQKQKLCMKVETHNSPSALDPYGGSITGIMGVQRDILGTGLAAKPIANIDVFCLSPFDGPPVALKVLPSQFMLDGVNQGVKDGGNKLGIPTVNGSFFFHPSYLAKPLVFCGTLGELPVTVGSRLAEQKSVLAGDLVVMVGGRVGKDGIHGATLSSMELTNETPTSMVQLGYPLLQRRLHDFLLEARKRDLFRAITDNGAGGLSSSVGEMCLECGGARLFLDRVPLKHQGMLPFEILISESQERMTLAVDPQKLTHLQELGEHFQVEVTSIGVFQNTGFFEFFWGDQLLGSLPLSFLRDGLQLPDLEAYWEPGQRELRGLFYFLESNDKFLPNELETLYQMFGPLGLDSGKRFGYLQDYSSNGKVDYLGFNKMLEQVLGHYNVRSRRCRIEKYDQHVQGRTLVRPYMGKTQLGAQNGAVLTLNDKKAGEDRVTYDGVALAHGLAPVICFWDPYVSAQWALDECVRHLICLGADPERIALLDNFSWPDPISGRNNPDGNLKLGELVRAAYGLHDLALCYRTPFISGKDSMKNDFVGYDQMGRYVKISVLPTVLVTGMGYIEDIGWVRPGFFIQPGDLIYYVSNRAKSGLRYSVFHQLFDCPQETDWVEAVDGPHQWQLYLRLSELLRKGLIQSIRDVSEGGIVTALCEASFGEDLGFSC